MKVILACFLASQVGKAPQAMKATQQSKAPEHVKHLEKVNYLKHTFKATYDSKLNIHIRRLTVKPTGNLK